MSKNHFQINKILKEFGAKNEEELLKKLDKEAKIIPCLICGKEMPIEKIHFYNGDPYCKECLEKEYEY